jgi:hypothetical protein
MGIRRSEADPAQLRRGDSPPLHGPIDLLACEGVFLGSPLGWSDLARSQMKMSAMVTVAW